MKVVPEVKKFLIDTDKQDYTLNSASSYVLAERLLGQKFWGISLIATPCSGLRLGGVERGNKLKTALLK